jgi:hypothetical protein
LRTTRSRFFSVLHAVIAPARVIVRGMKNTTPLAAAAVLALCLPVETSAQPCGSRALVGVAAGLLNVDIPVDPKLAGVGRRGLAKAGRGLEGSLHASLPIASAWSLLTEFGGGSLDVLLDRDASGAHVQTETGDGIALRRLNVGLMRYDVSPLACVYSSVRVGLYRFAYRGVTLNAPGGAGVIGIEVPVAASASVFFETELNLVLTKARPPITPAGALANVRPALGFRYRF